MIKKLQNNFTTPEQSKRLLELGLPASSSDLYYFSQDSDVPIIQKGKGVPLYPCWSAGRMIEIFIICTPYVEIRLRTRLIEQIIASYEDVIKQGMIDFSKLDE